MAANLTFKVMSFLKDLDMDELVKGTDVFGGPLSTDVFREEKKSRRPGEHRCQGIGTGSGYWGDGKEYCASEKFVITSSLCVVDFNDLHSLKQAWKWNSFHDCPRETYCILPVGGLHGQQAVINR